MHFGIPPLMEIPISPPPPERGSALQRQRGRGRRPNDSHDGRRRGALHAGTARSASLRRGWKYHWSPEVREDIRIMSGWWFQYVYIYIYG